MTVQTLPETRPETEAAPLVVLRNQLEERAEEFRMVLPSHISPAKLQRTVLTAVQLNPELLNCDRRSFLTACMKAAQDGLLPDGREAAIVPFKTRTKGPGGWSSELRAAYMPMVWGLRKKILQSGEIADIFAAVVYRQEIERGLFHYEEGTERSLRHKPILEPDFKPTDKDIALAYSVATFADGSKSFEVMRRWEIDDVREASQTGAEFDHKGERRDAKGPWVDWFAEMAKKTVVRRHAKSLPQSGDLIVTDVEADEMGFGAARTTARLLESIAPPAPELKTDSQEPPAPELKTDSQEPPAFQEPRFTPEPEPAPIEPPPVDQPEPSVDEPKTPSQEPEPDDQPDDGELKTPSQDFAEAAEFEADELGMTATDEERRAEEIVRKVRACEFLVDLRKLERETALELDGFSPEIAAAVDMEFVAARNRLQPPKKPQAGA